MRTSDPDIKKQLRVRAHEPAKPQGSGGEKNGWTWDEKRREGGEKSTASCSSGADVFEPYYHKLCQETSADLPQWQSSNSAVCSSVPSAARIFFFTPVTRSFSLSFSRSLTRRSFLLFEQSCVLAVHRSDGYCSRVHIRGRGE